MHAQPPKAAFRMNELTEITGLGRSTIYVMVGEGRFPKPRKLGTRAVGWLAEDVFLWLSEREVVT